MFSGIRTNEEDLLDALKHIDGGDHQSALPILGRVVAFDRTNALAYELWILCHLRVALIDRALQLIEDGLAAGIAPVRLNIQKSEALCIVGRLDEAADAARLALAMDAESSEAVLALAAVDIARGSGDAAIQIYQSALKRAPDDEDVHYALLTLASELARNELVIDSARDYLRRFERDPDVLSMLGRAYLALNDFRRADRAYRDAAHLDPEEVEHHVNVLIVALLAGKKKEFEAYLERLDLRSPELAEAAAHHIELLLSPTSEEE